MFLSYDGIVFEILKMDNWLREAVYTEDLTTFLYWHHVIEVTCILNDEATNAENFPNLIKRQPEFVNRSLKTVSATKLPAWAGAVGIDTNFTTVSTESSLPLIDPKALKNVNSTSVGGANVGSPGESKTFDSNTSANLFNGGGPGPLPNSVRKPKKSASTARPIIRRPFLDTFNRVPFPRNSHTIPTTDRELRGRLNLPRRKLAVWMLTGENGTPDYSLISPQGTCETDCKSGPICTVMDNVDIIGQMTSVMKLKFETWEGPPIQLNSSGNFVNRLANFAANISKAVIPKTVVPTPAVLSHRWEMSFGWNPKNYLKTRRIKGEVLFRSDVLGLRNLSADQLRPYFMAHTIPLGYIRVPDNGEMVKQNSEGTGIVYSITDEQQMMNNPGGVSRGIIKMEAVTDYTFHSGNFGQETGTKPPDSSLKSKK